MGRFGIGFNSQGHWTMYPGVVVSVDPSDLDIANQGPTGVVALIGSATGFFPPKQYSLFPSGAATPGQYIAPGSDLLTTVSFATRPFSQLGFGPGQIYIVPCNPALPATYDVQGSGGAAVATASLLDASSTPSIDLTTPKPTAVVATVATALTVVVASGIITITGKDQNGALLPDYTLNTTGLADLNSVVLALDSDPASYVHAAVHPGAGGAQAPSVIVDQTVTMPTPTAPPPSAAITFTTLGWGAIFNDLKVTITAPTGTAPGIQTITLALPTNDGLGSITETYTYTPTDPFSFLVNNINARSAIVSAALTGADGSGALTAVSDAPFTGGEDGTTTVNDWIEAIGALSTLRVSSIHVASGDPAVWDALSAYCDTHRARGFIGSSTTRNWNGILNRATAITALTAEAASVNDPRIMHCGLGMNGYAGKYASARYAALAASLEPSVPMTFKFLDVDSLETRLSVDECGGPSGLLVNGVSPPMPDAANAFTYRVSRGLSTWTGDSNLYRCEQSVLAAVDGIAQQLDDALQAYIGGEGNQGTLGRIATSVQRILELATRPTSAIRILSYDPNITVAFTSDTVVRVTCRVTPIAPINWINVNIVLLRTDIEISTEVNLAA